MRKTLALLTILLGVPISLPAQAAKELAGKYQLDAQGGDILELRADGTAVMAGDKTTWSAKNGLLKIGPDAMSYALQGDRLTLSMGSVPMVWKRLGGAAKTKAPPAAGKGERRGGGPAPARKSAAEKPHAAAVGGAQDAQVRQVLTANAWCSFTYNKVSGTSATRRAVFREDGVLTLDDGAETYSSGYGGTAAGQYGSASALRWKLQDLKVYVDLGQGGGFQDIGLTATRNSNGYIILHAEGREYSMCK